MPDPVVSKSLTRSATERGLRVTDQALAEFRATFLTANDVAKMAGLKSGRWTAERLEFIGIQAAAAPRDAGGIRWLYRRADITPDVLERLTLRKAERAYASPAKVAFDLAAQIGNAAGAALGKPVRRAWNGFTHEATDTYIQVIVGGRPRFKANYRFRFNAPMRKRLDAAAEGWLALALEAQPYFLLIPWHVAEEVVSRPQCDGDRDHIYVSVDGQGLVGAFGEWVRPLRAVDEREPDANAA